MSDNSCDPVSPAVSIREKSLEGERLLLCEFATRNSHPEHRKSREAPCCIRTGFQRDRDRIVHSNSFRRLKHKTQVFLLPKSDHFRTRLTHTLEVAQIARTISRALSLNEDLTEAIALGHDLGHTPFGHDGERALNKILPEGFRHNEQSVRVVEVIEKEGEGLNLTNEVIDGVLNHSSNSISKTLEGNVVRLSDKIAYINHDIEDAISSGILKENELPPGAIRVLGETKSQRITSLITSVVNNTLSLFDKAREQEMAGDNTDIIAIDYDKETRIAHDELRTFMFERIYNSVDINKEKLKAENVIEFLYSHYYSHIDEMPPLYQAFCEKYSVCRAVCDYISGMTDDFAVDRFIELCVPKSR